MLTTTIVPSTTIITTTTESDKELYWLNFFNPQEAYDSVVDHAEALPGSQARHLHQQRHSIRAYLGDVAKYCEYLGATYIRYGPEDYVFDFSKMRQPTKSKTQKYIAATLNRGASAKTVGRYLAAVRLFLRALEEQPVNGIGSGMDFMFVLEAQRQLRLAIAIKNPRPQNKTSQGALHVHGTRLTVKQVNELLASFEDEMETLTGKRDITIFYVGITSGLRASELARLTLNSISEGFDCLQISVIGKGNNIDPVPLDQAGYGLIMTYVDTWNSTLSPDDPRFIKGDTPIFQRILRGGHQPQIGVQDYNPSMGITPRAILKIVERRSTQIFGEDKKITAHDLRRTCASIMQSAGFQLKLIQLVLRHQSSATTDRYIGVIENLGQARVTNRVTFIIPKITPSEEPEDPQLPLAI